MTSTRKRLLIAASGTGGHLFPAIATASHIVSLHANIDIEWLGVPDRLEVRLVPSQYPLHTITVQGFQKPLGLGTIKTAWRLGKAIFDVRQLLTTKAFDGVLTTGGYIAAPSILAARSLGLPTILHESNALPGKVTRWLSPWCSRVAIGFDAAASYLPKAETLCVGTPVRPQFQPSFVANGDTGHDPTPVPLADLAIPKDVPLIIVVGGSQGAVSVNQMVRQSAPAWLKAGFWIVHLTGDNDPDAATLSHPHYIVRPFYDDMASLLRRADLAVSRAGAGTLTELAITRTPSILIPYPYAAEDHQTYNAAIFGAAGAATVYQQKDLTADVLQEQVLSILQSSDRLTQMADAAEGLAIADSAEQLANSVLELLGP
ncbi:MAG: undecaprenyldiphospho-muramoylpentapeptide beta-N-acetylglucosaminyltransferase [Merismopedia sp. SIO2A8]|nr:undecaprenyldiphospho-muramoylpentapeptide beta-N-acetylglucosaminyltransferase [Merismopedia sp. SIO2A8]